MAAWLACVVCGYCFLLTYEGSPGAAAQAATTMPSGTVIQPTKQEFSLVMFVHPQCPCTRASLHELELALTRSPKMQTYIVFLHPTDVDSSWVQSDLWNEARTIPNTVLIDDKGGALAARFGVTTSGEVLLYGPSRRLLFSGGITAARGHEGDNEGLNAVVALTNGRPTTVHSTNVFGCSLTDEPKKGV